MLQVFIIKWSKNIPTFTKIFILQALKTLPWTQSVRALASVATGATTAPNATSATISGPEPDKLYSKLEIELRGIDPAVLKSYTWFATTAADHLGIEQGKW